MDHQTLEEHQIPERYLLGQLPPDEASWFEEHTLYCSECRDRVETTAALLEGLRTVAVEDAATIGRTTVFSWLLGRSRRALVVGAALLLLMIAVPSFVLWRRVDQLTADLSDARVPRPAAMLALAAERSAVVAEPSHQVALGDRAGSVVLSLELDEAMAERYAVTLSDERGNDLWTISDLTPDHRESLSLAVPASALTVGVYQLRVDGVPADGTVESVAVGRYAFRAID